MGIRFEDLEELCTTLGKKLQEANDRIRKSGGDLSEGDMAYVDKLTHSIKSLKTVMAMLEGSSHDGSYYGGSGDYGNNSGRYSRYSGNYSNDRGRGRYAERDSMGRYSGSGAEEMVTQLRELMHEAPDEQIRRDFERLISKIEK